MHLRPARYQHQQQAPLMGSGQPGEPYGTLEGSSWQQQQQQRQTKSSMSVSSSSTSMVSLIDGGYSYSNNNNNRQVSSSQFTAIKQQSASSMIPNRNALPGTSDLTAATGGGGGGGGGGSKANQVANRAGIIVSSSGMLMRATTNNTNNHNSDFASASGEHNKHDKMKLMELAIINLVELSAMAAEEGKLAPALERARQALEGFNGLKVACLTQDKGNPNSNQPADTLQGSPRTETTPMTTGVSLSELSLMIQSNLAAQLANNGHFEEAIELYTQLCKLATAGGLGPGANQAAAGAASRNSQQQHETRFLLYRFGLNIGNIHHRMGEYQRALKYYRLTLDRLSASSAHRTLRLKVMHNIGLALIAMGQFADATASLNLLLADNLTANESQPQTSAQGSSSSSSASASATATNPLAAYNSNHHEFGLKLLVCQYQLADLNSMMATLRSLSKVAICQHYERVFDLMLDTAHKGGGNGSRPDDHGDGQWVQSSAASRSSSSSTVTTATGIRPRADDQHGRMGGDVQCDGDGMIGPNQRQGVDETIRALASDPAVRGSSLFMGGNATKMTSGRLKEGESVETFPSSSGGRNSNQGLAGSTSEMNSRQMISDGRWTDDETGTAGGRQRLMGGDGGGGDSSEVDRKRCGRRGSLDGSSQPARLMKLSAAERTRQLMGLIREDRLEWLICDKQKEISRSLIMGCNLVLDLDNRMAAGTNTNRTLPPGDSPSLESNNKTSAFEFCLKLLATSDCYRALVYELKANCVSGMLGRKYELDEAIAMLNGMGLAQEQQVDPQSHNVSLHRDNPTTGANKSMVKMAASNNHNIRTTNKMSNSMMIPLDRSSMVATNCSLFNLLRGNTKRALEYGEQAFKLDKFNVQALINLANAHYMLSDLVGAEKLYERALLIDPNSWEANYNLALLNRKLGRHYNELKGPIKSMLVKCSQCLTSLIWNRMILVVVQLAMIYHQSGMKQQSFSIINDLISSQKSRAPEIILLASRLMDDNLTIPAEEPTSGKQSAMSILQQTNRDHPYDLPVAERLIALNIQNFNYDQSIALLCNCIINRPDLVKWYQMMAECYRRAADYNKAIATYRIAVDAFPQDTGCLKALVKLTDELGLIEEKRNFSNKLEATLRRFDLQRLGTTATNHVDVRYNYAQIDHQ